MANPQQPVRARPGIVTISSYLIFFYAVLALIDMVIGLTTVGTFQDVLRDAYAGTEAEGAEAVVVFMVVAMSLVSLLFAAGLVVLALLNNRGMNTARIITWVVGGIALCCTSGSLALSTAGTVGGEATDDGISQEEINRRLEESLPSWHEPVLKLTATLGVISLLVALILLALPKANEFFRKPQQQWEPPVPGTAYPMTPGGPVYPTTPGASYPTTPGQSGYPQADPSTGAPGQPGSPGGDPSTGSSGQSGSSGSDWSSGSSGSSGSSDSGGGGHSGGYG
ncbi:hypothetical protein [Salinispora cortesiana]|uniref:hypothetical protein n=1 Tax=Salinispora cortesiana TaxID=1305843 RepID=UPI00041D10D8|nr:hypothetical protein [Salinispora cortesiana]